MKPTDPFILLGFGDGGWGWALAGGILVTMEIALLAWFLGVLIGMVGALAKLRGPRWARGAAEGYTTIVQSLPDLLVILFIYYGGTSLIRDIASFISPDITIEINAFAAGVFALAVIAGSYSTEIFRAAFQSIPKGQDEAARSLGLTSFKVFWLIILPQAFKKALPPLGNNWLVTLKDSALISVVGIRDLVGVAASGAAATRQHFTFYLFVASVFLVLSIVSMIALGAMEKRLARSDAGR